MLHVGIDTGRDTGFAVWDGDRFTDIRTLRIHEAILRVLELAQQAATHGAEQLAVYVEDARLRTWIPREKSYSEAKGRAMGAGSVKRDASIWEDFCKDYGIPLVKVPPRCNVTKLDADPFCRITGWKGRTSEHARDAAMLVFQRNSNTFKSIHQ